MTDDNKVDAVDDGDDEDRDEQDLSAEDDEQAPPTEHNDDEDLPPEDDDDRGPTRRREGARRHSGRVVVPRRMRLTIALIAMVPVATYAANCVINLHAREQVVERCVAEDHRLEVAVGERNELRLDDTDWMVILYGARRRYVAELCTGALHELRWWRWNLSRDIEIDVGRASQRDISRALEQAAETCGGQVDRLENALDRHVIKGGADPELAERVRQVSRGQAGACTELRRAVADSRQGFWPALRSRGAKALPVELANLMPLEEDEAGNGQ